MLISSSLSLLSYFFVLFIFASVYFLVPSLSCLLLTFSQVSGDCLSFSTSGDCDSSPIPPPPAPPPPPLPVCRQSDISLPISLPSKTVKTKSRLWHVKGDWFSSPSSVVVWWRLQCSSGKVIKGRSCYYCYCWLSVQLLSVVFKRLSTVSWFFFLLWIVVFFLY